ncbi:hypothetical protein [Kribbella qitaiheensis]|nr:hypothetical protein [Kribbella qitaiheensis]
MDHLFLDVVLPVQVSKQPERQNRVGDYPMGPVNGLEHALRNNADHCGR